MTGSNKPPSRSSSRRSQRGAKDAARTSENPSAPPDSGSTLGKPKKSGVSRFLAILNCCRAPSEGHAVHADEDEPVRKAPNAKAGRDQQNATAHRHDLEQADKQANDIKDRPEPGKDTQRLPQSVMTSSEKRAPASAQTDHSRGEKSIPGVPFNDQNPAGDKLDKDKPLPASPMTPQTSALPNPAEAARSQGMSQSHQPAVALEPPTPVSSEEQVISDRTPSQKAMDEDIEMTDAPPTLPLAQKDVAMTDEVPTAPKQADRSSKVDLPPPPPPGDRQVAPPPPPSEHPAAKSPEPAGGAASTASDERKWLLPPIKQEMKGRKCLVLDLDETLVHSSFKVSPDCLSLWHEFCSPGTQILHQADFTIPVEIEGQYHNVYVIKRPGVDQFMKRVGELYEVVVFTASVAKVCANQ